MLGIANQEMCENGTFEANGMQQISHFSTEPFYV